MDCGCDGAYSAEVAIIAEAPGERERIMKMPLCGSSGKYLWDSLRKYGITRQKCYVSNVIKRQLLSINIANIKEKIAHGEVSLLHIHPPVGTRSATQISSMLFASATMLSLQSLAYRYH